MLDVEIDFVRDFGATSSLGRVSAEERGEGDNEQSKGGPQEH